MISIRVGLFAAPAILALFVACSSSGSVDEETDASAPATNNGADSGLTNLSDAASDSSSDAGDGVSLLPEPGLTNPRFLFNNGKVSGGVAQTFLPATPNMPAYPTPSRWHVAQWSRTDLLEPGVMSTDPASIIDPLFGHALYAFPSVSPDGGVTDQSHLWIFNDSSTNHLVYELFEQGGYLSKGGGTDTFLSVGAIDSTTSQLDSQVILSFATRISENQLLVDDPDATPPGAVLAQFSTGLDMHFQDPDTGNGVDVFLQIPHANSGNKKSFDAYCSMSNAGSALPNSAGLLYQAYLAGDTLIEVPQSSTLQSDSAPMQQETIDINQYTCSMVRYAYNCSSPNGTYIPFSFPAAASALKNWTVRSLYIGPEVESALARPDGGGSGPSLGNAALGVQIENLRLMRYPGTAPSTGAVCAL